MTDVSVVIPVYARQEQATAAIRSALAQEGVGFEIVVVDDGSPEPFVLVPGLAADARVRLLRLDRNRGAAAARNRGVEAARAPWIAFLDSDDTWRPGKLAAQCALACEASARGAAAATAYVTGFRQIETAAGTAKDRIPVAASSAEDLAAGCWFAPGSTALLSRAAFLAAGGFDERLARLEDLDLFLRFGLSGGGVKVLPRICADVHIGGRPRRDRLESAIARLRAKWIDAGPEATRLSPRARRNLAAYLLVERASNRYHDGDYPGFVLALARSVLLAPRTRLHLKPWWNETTMPPSPAPGDGRP